MNKTRLFLILSASLLTFLAIWYLSGLNATKIGTIISDPGGFEGKTVRIIGRVDPGTEPFVLYGIYKVSDDTGSIWVVTNIGIPPRSREIPVVGKIVSSYRYGSMKLSPALIEESRD